MARTNTGRLLRRFHTDAIFSRRTGVEVTELHERVDAMSRRRFLAGSAGLGAALMLPTVGCSSPSPSASGRPSEGSLRVAVVGAGLAGLTCAYRLSQAGVDVSVFEASDRLGGRTRTLRGHFADNRTAESGAAAINTDQAAIRSLVRELGLELDDLYSGYPSGLDRTWYFDGGPYSTVDAVRDWDEIAPAVQRDFDAAGADVRWDNHTDAAVVLDRMSVPEWIEANVPDGRSSRLGRLIEVNQESEWAGPVEEQSALLFLTMVGSAIGNNANMLGSADERWHVSGGNDRIAARLADALPPGTVKLGSSLVAARDQGTGVRCSFDQSGSITDFDADRVVMALPFSTLRSVDLAGLELSDRKRRVIAEQPIGSNSKLHLEFARRAWRDNGADGDSMSDTDLMVTWEEVITEPGPTGVMVVFTGGTRGAAYGFSEAHGEAPASVVAATAPDLETVFGAETPAAATGRGWLDSWVDDPYTRGSYSYWGVGQHTELRGAGGVPEGRAHFCGEHTSLDDQGYMDGAVDTGERAAQELLTS